MVIPVAFHAGMLPYFMFFFLLLLPERAERVNTKWGNNKYGGRFNLCLTFVVRWAGHTPEWTNSLFFGSAPVALCCFRERKKKTFRSTIGYKTLVNFALCGPWPSRVTDQPPPDSLSPSILSNWNSYFVLSYYLPRESWWRELKVHLREVVKLMKISYWVYSTKLSLVSL